jgi:hypothetical protein
MTTYLAADDDSLRLLAEARAKYHPVLDEVGVTVSLVMAIAAVDKEGNKTGPAIKVRGLPAYARVRIRKHLDRVQGSADAEIVLDGDEWTFFSRERKLAVLDRELTRLELVIDDEGKPAVDDGGRPVLRFRQYDFEVSGFHEVLERHGAASTEQKTLAAAVFDHYGQRVFDFFAVKAEVQA